jgi:predicted secreted hydrolase
MDLTVRTPLADQELVVPPISYWEGAIRATGTRAGKPISAEGYMELTGYTGELVGLKKGPE